jgi:amino acid transporter
MAATTGEMSLFVRKATGLVRAWSVFDAFIYATFSINLITLGLYIFSQMYFIGGFASGALIPTVLITGLFILFEVVVYAALIAVMPRAGGDYVWQSRILGGGIGFVLSVTGWWFILWYWVPLYADMLRYEIFTPLLAVLGLKDLAIWFTVTPEGAVASVVALLVFVSIVIGLGMRAYSRVQKFCFWVGMAGLLAVFALLLFGSQEGFKQGLEAMATKLFGAAPGVYDATVVAAGTQSQPFAPFAALGAVFVLAPYIVFFNLWPNWGATLYGEVRGATDFKRNFWGMAWALIVTTILAVVFFLLIAKTIGWDFYTAANAAFWNWKWGWTDAAAMTPLIAWPYPAMFAVALTSSPILQFLILFAVGLWFFGWAGTVFLSSTRVIFAAAFDRLLPEWVAEVHPRFRTPINALILMVVPGFIVGVLYAYNLFNFQSLTLASTMVIAVTYLGSTLAAILLPWRKPDLFKGSPIASYKVGGVPLISIAGIIFLVFLLFLLAMWILDPVQAWGNATYGLVWMAPAPDGTRAFNWPSVLFMLGMYVLALVIYFGFKAYRKRQGIEIDKVYKEIPVE